MPAYDAVHYQVPAPVVHAVLRHPDTGNRVEDIVLLIDSGADVTLLPRAAIDQLGVVIMDDQYEIMGFDGRITLAAVARVDLLFLRRTFKGRYLLIDQDHGILGRDILNLLALVLDGPSLTWYDQRPIANKT